MPVPSPPSAAIEAAATLSVRWQVRLLGAVEARDGSQHLQRFPSRAVALLLARVAGEPQRAHAREELIEMIWPGVAPAVGRNRLRQALSTLKSLLEPAGGPAAPVLLADRLSVRAAPAALDSDAAAFQRCLQQGRRAQALAFWGGPFMPGYYDDWVQGERERLAHLHEGLLHEGLRAEHAAASAGPGSPAHDPGVPPRPVPPAPQAAADSTLPHYLTRLFGAERPASRLHAQVLAQRLVSLVGPGGSGKTRLAVEVAAGLRAAPGRAAPLGQDGPAAPGFDSVCFVGLVGCSDAAGLQQALARALRLPGGEGVEALLPALAGLRVLLVLDNFEQLVGRAESLVVELLARLPGLHVLVTSRRPLGLDGELLCAAEPLPLPAQGLPLAETAANPAVALFVDRARAARSDFHLTAGNVAAIAGLVRALQGLPLAIELAASRVRSFAPAELLRLLTAPTGPGRLELLARRGVRAAGDPRHASMHAVIAWSWSLLDSDARHLVQALALLPAAASASAVAAVCGLPLAHAAALLDDLVSQSLLRVQAAEPARFELQEPVREYALLQAQPSTEGGAQDAQTRDTLQRWRQWLLHWARGLPRPLRHAQVSVELPLVHALLSDAPQAPTEALQLAVLLRDHWETGTLPMATLRSLERALATLPAGDALRADAHELLALLRFSAGFADEARAHADAAVAAAGSDAPRRARALVRRAWVDVAGGRTLDRAGPRHIEARARLDEALALARGVGDRDAQARALHQLGVLSGHVHASPAGADVVAAEALFAQAQALWQALGDSRRAHARLRNRAQCWAQLGRLDEAMAALQQCERADRAEGNWIGQIDSLISLAELLVRQRQWGAALDSNRRCLALCWQHWFRHGLAYALWNPSLVLARLRQPEAAAQLMAFASVFWTTQFGPLTSADRHHMRRVRALVTRQIGPVRTEALWQRGLTLDVARAVRLVVPDG